MKYHIEEYQGIIFISVCNTMFCDIGDSKLLSYYDKNKPNKIEEKNVRRRRGFINKNYHTITNPTS